MNNKILIIEDDISISEKEGWKCWCCEFLNKTYYRVGQGATVSFQVSVASNYYKYCYKEDRLNLFNY